MIYRGESEKANQGAARSSLQSTPPDFLLQVAFGNILELSPGLIGKVSLPYKTL